MNHQSIITNAITGGNLFSRSANISGGPSLDKGHVRFLQALHADFTPELSPIIRHYLPTAEVALLSLEETTADAFAQRQFPRYGANLRMALPNAGSILATPVIARLLVNRLLEKTTLISHFEHPLSELEGDLLRSGLEPVVEGYSALWNRHLPLSITLDGPPVPARSQEPLFIASYAIQTADGYGELLFLLALSCWRDVLQSIPSLRPEAPSQESLNTGLLGTLGECVLTASAVLGSTRMTVQDLLNLRTGDIICLGRTPNTPLEIRVNNHPKLLGSVRVERGHYLVTVEDNVAKGTP